MQKSTLCSVYESGPDLKNIKKVIYVQICWFTKSSWKRANVRIDYVTYVTDHIKFFGFQNAGLMYVRECLQDFSSYLTQIVKANGGKTGETYFRKYYRTSACEQFMSYTDFWNTAHLLNRVDLDRHLNTMKLVLAYIHIHLYYSMWDIYKYLNPDADWLPPITFLFIPNSTSKLLTELQDSEVWISCWSASPDPVLLSCTFPQLIIQAGLPTTKRPDGQY